VPPFAPGDVIRIWDRHTRPNKRKLHICIDPERQLFLRINSEAVFPPTHRLARADCPFLHHDSYVELQALTRHIADDIARAEEVGRLSRQVRAELLVSVRSAETLTDEQKSLIAEALG